MSAWRRRATELVPSQKRAIDGARNPMDLWISLHFACDHALRTEPPDAALASAIFALARESLASRNRDLQTAVVVAFYENVVADDAVRKRLHEYLSADEFRDLESIFAYHLGSEGVAQLSQDFHRRRELKFRPKR